MLEHIKTDIDSLIKETHSNSIHYSSGRLSAHDDLKLLNDNYEKCVVKLKDLSDKSFIKGRNNENES